MNCYYHPDRPSVAVCVLCGKNLCTECILTKEGRNYCRECLERAEVHVDLEKILVPGLVCGAVAGILSAVPPLSLLNCFFCLWIVLGGALAVYLLKYFNRIKGKITMGAAALTGGFTGLVAGIVSAVASAFIGKLFYSLMRDTTMAPEFQDFFGGSFLYEPFGILLVFLGVVTTFFYIIFGALGGIISNELTK